MRYLKKLKMADLLVIVILLVALIAAWIAIRTYVKKEEITRHLWKSMRKSSLRM